MPISYWLRCNKNEEKMTDSNILDAAQHSKPWNASQKADVVLSLVALSQIILSTVQGVLIAVGMPEEMASTYRVYLSAISIIIGIPILLKRYFAMTIITYLVVLAVYSLHTVIFPATVDFWKAEAFKFTLPICIPTALSVISIKDRYIFYYYLKVVAYITGFLSLLYGLRVFLGIYDLGFSYNQGFGYMLLFPIIVLFYQRKWYSLLFAGILFMLLLLYGARAPLLSLAVFFVYVLVSQKKFTLLIALVVIMGVSIPILNSTLESYGLSSRTLELYLSGDLDADNGRDVIRDEVMKGVHQNPYGWGLFGDRVITHGENNAHSFIREILAEFGLFLGVPLLLLFLFELIRRFLRLKEGDRDIYMLFLCACFIPTLVSGSYLTSTNFAIFVGITILLPKYYRKKKSIYHNNIKMSI